jgi:hypothetical protein
MTLASGDPVAVAAPHVAGFTPLPQRAANDVVTGPAPARDGTRLDANSVAQLARLNTGLAITEPGQLAPREVGFAVPGGDAFAFFIAQVAGAPGTFSASW